MLQEISAPEGTPDAPANVGSSPAERSPGSPTVPRITFEEFLVKYDGQHAEWFPDGTVLVHMAANEKHQNILIFLTSLLNLFLSLKQIGRMMVAPFTMKVSDDQPAREPDIMILLNEHLDRIGATRLRGAADIAIEIVSPESVARDYGDKFEEYERAGVTEYWLFDPEREVARVCELSLIGEKRVYKERPLDAQGRLTSGLLPGFTLDPRLLWQDELPGGMDLLNLVGGMTGISITRADQSGS